MELHEIVRVALGSSFFSFSSTIDVPCNPIYTYTYNTMAGVKRPLAQGNDINHQRKSTRASKSRPRLGFEALSLWPTLQLHKPVPLSVVALDLTGANEILTDYSNTLDFIPPSQRH